MSIGHDYEVIGIEADYYRVINDDKEPFLYNPNQFKVVDSIEPQFWVTEYGEEGEKYSYPPTWSATGFFEDYFDGVKKIVNQFWSDYERLFHNGKSV